MDEIIVIAIITIIVGGALAYIIKAKKSGKKCIGCPDGCSCSSKNKKGKGDNEGGCSCCSCHEDK